MKTTASHASFNVVEIFHRCAGKRTGDHRRDGRRVMNIAMIWPRRAEWYQYVR